MIAQYFTVGDTTPVLLIGPVDADYDVRISGVSNLWFGASNTITASPGGDGFHDVTTGADLLIKLKIGDSLYAITGGGNVQTSVFAQPC